MKYLNEILIEWNDSGIEDNGIIKSDDVKDSFGARGFIANGVKFNMIKIPDENYYIGETVVTQELYMAVMGENPSKLKRLQHPVDSVSIDECRTFIQELNRITGINFHLQTIDEWENALGDKFKKLFGPIDNTRSSRYYNNQDSSGEIEYSKLEEWKYIWSRENSNGAIHHPVKTKLPNEYGIYDLMGNVWEYCEDSNFRYSYFSYGNVVGKGCSTKIGIWQFTWHTCWEQCASPRSNHESIGFRLALIVSNSEIN